VCCQLSFKALLSSVKILCKMQLNYYSCNGGQVLSQWTTTLPSNGLKHFLLAKLWTDCNWNFAVLRMQLDTGSSAFWKSKGIVPNKQYRNLYATNFPSFFLKERNRHHFPCQAGLLKNSGVVAAPCRADVYICR